MVACGECKGSMSSEAVACPACGHPAPPKPTHGRAVFSVVALLLVVGAGAGLFAWSERREPPAPSVCAGTLEATVENVRAIGFSPDPGRDLDTLARSLGRRDRSQLTFLERRDALMKMAGCEGGRSPRGHPERRAF